jgi:hypothetical protein
MKNADRINFYAAGLRTPAAAGTPPGSAPAPGLGLMPKPGSPAANGGNAPVMEQLSGRGQPSATGTPQSPVLDQAKLHHLLQRLDHSKQRQGDGQAVPAAIRRRHRHLVIGLILALTIIAIQASAAIWLYQRAELLLGRPLSPALLLTAMQGDLDVVFRPSASSGDISVLLRELDLRVVDGPNDAGRYVLRPERAEDRDRSLNALRDRRDLVYSAAVTD